MSSNVSFVKLVETATAFDLARVAVENEPKYTAFVAEKKKFGAIVKSDETLTRDQISTLSGKALKKVTEWLKRAKDEEKSNNNVDTFQAAHKSFNAAFDIVKDVQSYQTYRLAKKAFKREVISHHRDNVSTEVMQKALQEANASARAVFKVAYYKFKA